MLKFSDTVRAFPFPVLEDGNLSFPEGEYLPEITSNDDGYSARIYHKVNNAPLIERFVNEGRAVCCCTVSVPITGYRELFTGSGFNQDLQWDRNWVGGFPFLRPLIVCKDLISHKLCAEDGVHSMWVGQAISFDKGSKIAIGPDFRPVSSIQSLLSINKNESLASGQFRINEATDNGFYFKVEVASDLYKFLQQPGGGDHSKHRHSILIHAVSSCFALLAKDYREEHGDKGWQPHSNLRALAGEMESKGLNVWDEDDFCPEFAATSLYPHQLPVPEEE
ncbi:MAG: hypothetical protein OXD47_13135 [Gammaproteobacteria bacterium]|nr:hypothetical protein [Gammaproteobacteria bacterium]MCY4339711.1 hypothetical protein [Gammaproteobacteria bacterium]